MTTYYCWIPEDQTRIAIEADSPAEAAQEYVDGGDWGDTDESTRWVTVAVAEEPDGDDAQDVRVTLEPTEPECAEGESHDWRAPYAVLGGLEENPGVWGNGGGVILRRVCRHCGTYRVTDTWAQDPETGEQGLTSVSYEEADDDSLAWVRATEAPRRLAACDDLDDLQELLQDRDYSEHLDWTDLPTYGGEEPSDTSGVWSWDETRLLVGTCASDLRIVDRCPRCGRASEGDEQHGIVRVAEESGDGMVHDGGCDHCCACVGQVLP